MYKHILIATDGSDLADTGVKHGLLLAKSLGSKCTIVTVTQMWSALVMADQSALRGGPDVVNLYEGACAALAKKTLEHAEAAARKADVTCELVHVKDSLPAEGIVRTAEDKKCDLIVMASHGRRGIQRMLLGSQAAEVLATSNVPVLVVR